MTVEGNAVALLAAEHPIKSVTIFQSSTAEITREFSASIKVCLVHLNVYLSAVRPLVDGGREAETSSRSPGSRTASMLNPPGSTV